MDHDRAPAAEPVEPALRPLLICGAPALLEELLRLCAVTGVEPVVSPDPGGDRAAWGHAPLVIVGGDAAEQTAALVATGSLMRREGVLLVSADLDDAEVWRRAVGIGVEQVGFLPDAEDWLAGRLAGIGAGPSRDGVVLGVVGGRGGAGASTLAAALAVTGARRGLATMLVDADPLGGGIDLAVGVEQLEGLRWPALAGLRGLVPGEALSAALPSVGELTVLSWDREDAEPIGPAAMAALLDAAPHGSDLVVVDLPRAMDPAARLALSRCASVLLVVPAEIRACAAAVRVVAALEPECRDVRLVVRGPGPARLPPASVADAVGLPMEVYLRSEPAVAQTLERGEPPGRSGGALARAAGTLLDSLLRPPARAA